MNAITRAHRNLGVGIIAAVCCLSQAGCDGDYAVPITSGPTRKIDQRLTGNWVSKDGTDKVKVRQVDDSTYVVSYNGDLFRAFHSDVGQTPFVSVQEIDSPNRKYLYLTYKVSEDGKRLDLRIVSAKLVPKETKDSAGVQKLLKKNLQNPELVGEEGQFVRQN